MVKRERTIPARTLVLGTYVVLCVFGAVYSNAQITEVQPIEVNATTDDIVRPAEMLEILKSHRRGRNYFAKQDYENAYPWLLVAAKGGFKEAQAQLGYMYQEGKGVEKSNIKAIAWFGVAAEGTTTPQIKNHFRKLKSAVPSENVQYVDRVVTGYIANFGSESTRVSCDLHRPTGSHISRIKCMFKDAHKYRDEINAIDKASSEPIFTSGGAPF